LGVVVEASGEVTGSYLGGELGVVRLESTDAVCSERWDVEVLGYCVDIDVEMVYFIGAIQERGDVAAWRIGLLAFFVLCGCRWSWLGEPGG